MQLLTTFIAILLLATSSLTETKVDFKLGHAEFYNGDNIKIKSIISSTDKIEKGTVLTVTGTYTLNSFDSASLSFYTTSRSKTGKSPVDPSQKAIATKGTHSFSLTKIVSNPKNFPHLTFYKRNSKGIGKPFGGVYFGTDKDNTLLKKSWKYLHPAKLNE